MELNYFYSLTPVQFQNISKGRQSFIEWQTQTSWEQLRWQTVMLLQPHTKKNKKIKPTDLGVFPWEETESQKLKRQQDPASMFKQLLSKKQNS